MGDLGGGSLELVALEQGQHRPHVTLPLGPLRLMESGRRHRAAHKIIDEHLDEVDWLSAGEGPHLLSGRRHLATLARIHMEQTHYPLHVIHEYAIERRAAEDLARVVSRLGKRTLTTIAGISKRRVETLPLAALVLERLLRAAKPARILFSAYGLREGLVRQAHAGRAGADPAARRLRRFRRARRPLRRSASAGRLDRAAVRRAMTPARLRRAALPACSPTSAGASIRIIAPSSLHAHAAPAGRRHRPWRARVLAVAIAVRYGSDEPTLELAKLVTLLDDRMR